MENFAFYGKVVKTRNVIDIETDKIIEIPIPGNYKYSKIKDIPITQLDEYLSVIIDGEKYDVCDLVYDMDNYKKAYVVDYTVLKSNVTDIETNSHISVLYNEYMRYLKDIPKHLRTNEYKSALIIYVNNKLKIVEDVEKIVNGLYYMFTDSCTDSKSYYNTIVNLNIETNNYLFMLEADDCDLILLSKIYDEMKLSWVTITSEFKTMIYNLIILKKYNNKYYKNDFDMSDVKKVLKIINNSKYPIKVKLKSSIFDFGFSIICEEV